ncbi:arylsulfatase [Ottowia sp.]|uniref:arylsulfatase n=1 Tax=Ottowia sp. TaxID=1898956 RepID=UPI002C455230|nr:arylsulfatase [Ottowia sp.]HNR84146.1 arylsulfatase [Ottowia sp.]HNT85680.1 arylsulfatase [Ottowia sp.]
MSSPDTPRTGRTIAESVPHWPARPQRPAGAPNILVILFDDVGFSDFGCYGSSIRTPNIDGLAAQGLRYTGFHTTAMCSTTRAALLTGRNHHAVGMGCLANFDSGFDGYRGKISPAAGTLAEMLRPQGWRNYMVGKWHVTPLTQTGPAGPYDGWPLGRGFDRYYGFMDAETDQYAPELVRDNTHVDPPATPDQGYHLTADLVDEAIRMLADHQADAPDAPWLLWLALGACHAPHQAPQDLIRSYDSQFAHGWDVEREQRLARQKALGLVPADTELPPRNDGVPAWDTLGEAERRVFTRLQSAFAGMLDHADQHIGRLLAFLRDARLDDDTLVLVLSDNGASQEGGPLGFVNAMGPYNLKPEDMAEKLRRIDDIGGIDTHSNFPQGWAMASNTPLKRYKQNTHGGGIRDPLVMAWPKGISARGELRHPFCHASDLLPTLLELCRVQPPAQINGVAQLPISGQSFAASLADPAAPARATPQYFEMFGHRGIWHQGWKAVAWHAPGTPFDADRWELYHLAEDFAENHNRADSEPERLKALQDLWWREAEANQVLPLDERFGARFAENARRSQGARSQFVFHAGMGHLPTDVAPDVRSRSYRIEAELLIPEGGAEGVLIAHGDATSGYSLYLQGGHLVHDLNIGGLHQLLRSDRAVPPGRRRLAFSMTLGPMVLTPPIQGLGRVEVPSSRRGSLFIDGEPVGETLFKVGFTSLISWSGLDIGRDRASPVSHYAAPFEFTGRLFHVTLTLAPQQALAGAAIGQAEMARQ